MTTMTSVLQKAPLEGNHVQLSKLKHLFGIVIILFQFFFLFIEVSLESLLLVFGLQFFFFSFVKVIVHCRVLLGRVARSILKSQALNWRNTDPFCSTVELFFMLQCCLLLSSYYSNIYFFYTSTTSLDSHYVAFMFLFSCTLFNDSRW